MAEILDGLNPAQREAVVADARPLLIIAGAGSGKTNTLAHRVAQLVLGGADPRRILLLTFSRRAAAEMSVRTARIIARSGSAASDIGWAGTFHAIANRLLRLHAGDVGLDASFTVLDRSDSADSIDVVRNDLGLAKSERRFPKKSTCLAIYSRAVNAQEPLQKTLDESFPWCKEHGDALKRAVRRLRRASSSGSTCSTTTTCCSTGCTSCRTTALAARVRRRFDHVLVDEYQDTNALQAQILLRLAPDGRGVTVVGDDAQSIYAFRAATVRNILDFPEQFSPPARVVTLEQNYRSTQPILDAANAVIALAAERFTQEPATRRARRPSGRCW